MKTIDIGSSSDGGRLKNKNLRKEALDRKSIFIKFQTKNLIKNTNINFLLLSFVCLFFFSNKGF